MSFRLTLLETPQGTPRWEPSPEQVIQEMPSALRLYLRSSSTWMLVSGRKSRGARLAGRSRLANTRDRMRMETKRPAREGGHTRRGWGSGEASRALAKGCSLHGGAGVRVSHGVGRPQHASLWVELARDQSSRVGGCLLCVTWVSGYKPQAHTPGQAVTISEHLVYRELARPVFAHNPKYCP